MRALRFLLVFALFFSAPMRAQQATSTSPQASVLLAQAFSAMVGTASVTDVTLTATARRVAGSVDETGTATLKALVTGEALMSFNFPSGQRSELRTVSTQTPGSAGLGSSFVATPFKAPVGKWMGPDGVTHDMAIHNLMTEPTWFFPALTLGRMVASQGVLASYVGLETRDGQSVHHVSVTKKFVGDSDEYSALMEHLNQTNLFLDSSTLLPVALTFNAHPNDNANVDVPTEVRFLDYRTFNGMKVPFRVQEYVNNSLVWDLQYTKLDLNTGLSAVAFRIQ